MTLVHGIIKDARMMSIPGSKMSSEAKKGEAPEVGTVPDIGSPIDGSPTKSEDLKQKDEDRKLASRIADVVASALDKVKPVTDMITKVSHTLCSLC